MTYAKVKDSELILYPYTFGTLQSENPYTNYGNDWDVEVWYPGTEDAIKNGYTLASVAVAPEPTYDPAAQTCTPNEKPTLVNGVWTLEWTVAPMTPEQEQAYQARIKAQNKTKAQQLLQETDWVEVPSVTNTSNTPHLANAVDFLSYRNAVRAIAVNPPVTPATFPAVPMEQWSS
jgi:hypothetical protein